MMQAAGKPMIYTHSGPFHVDELMAIALLKTLAFPGQDVEIKRTRDAALLDEIRADPSVFLVDVGLEYDPGKRNFDHHQTSLSRNWDDGTPMSSCGLVWSWLVEQGMVQMDPQAQALVEAELIRPIDAHDNGLSKWPVAAVFRLYNRNGATGPEHEANFFKALDVACDLAANQLHQCRMEAQAKLLVEQAWNEVSEQDEGIVVLRGMEEYRNIHALVARASNFQANFMLYPRSVSKKNNQWFIRALPEAEGSSINRMRFPSAWRGINDTTIALDGQEPVSMRFVHKTGFLGQINGSLNDAVRLARALVAHPENQPAMPPTSPRRTSPSA